jgi:hypothetical protein
VTGGLLSRYAPLGTSSCEQHRTVPTQGSGGTFWLCAARSAHVAKLVSTSPTAVIWPTATFTMAAAAAGVAADASERDGGLGNDRLHTHTAGPNPSMLPSRELTALNPVNTQARLQSHLALRKKTTGS